MATDFGGVEIPFVTHLGFRLTRFEGGHSQIDYAPKPEHLNSFEVTHGGAVMTLLDVTLATAARSISPELGVVTIEMKTSFMRPAKVPPGTSLIAKGTLMHHTKSMAFTEGTVYDDKGQACAHATGTFKYVQRRDAEPAQVGRVGAPGISTD